MEKSEITEIFAIVMNAKSEQVLQRLFLDEEKATQYWANNIETCSHEVHRYVRAPKEEQGFVYDSLIAWTHG